MNDTTRAVLCGSLTRHGHLFAAAAEHYWRQGCFVYAPVLDDGRTEEEHARFHREQIDRANLVVVVTDETGYVGESTASEREYAKAKGVLVETWTGVSSDTQDLRARLAACWDGDDDPSDAAWREAQADRAMAVVEPVLSGLRSEVGLQKEVVRAAGIVIADQRERIEEQHEINQGWVDYKGRVGFREREWRGELALALGHTDVRGLPPHMFPLIRKVAEMRAERDALSTLLRGMARRVGEKRAAIRDLSARPTVWAYEAACEALEKRRVALVAALGLPNGSGFYEAVEDVAELRASLCRPVSEGVGNTPIPDDAAALIRAAINDPGAHIRRNRRDGESLAEWGAEAVLGIVQSWRGSAVANPKADGPATAVLARRDRQFDELAIRANAAEEQRDEARADNAEYAETLRRIVAERDRLDRKVSFYIDLLNRTLAEREEVRRQSTEGCWFLWVQQHPVTGLEIAQALYADQHSAREQEHVTDPGTWQLWEARPAVPQAPVEPTAGDPVPATPREIGEQMIAGAVEVNGVEMHPDGRPVDPADARCSNPPSLSCADAGCPEHGDPDGDDDATAFLDEPDGTFDIDDDSGDGTGLTALRPGPGYAPIDLVSQLPDLPDPTGPLVEVEELDDCPDQRQVWANTAERLVVPGDGSPTGPMEPGAVVEAVCKCPVGDDCNHHAAPDKIEPFPVAGQRAHGTDLDGRSVAGVITGFFAWSYEAHTNLRTYLALDDGSTAAVHAASLRAAAPQASSTPTPSPPVAVQDDTQPGGQS